MPGGPGADLAHALAELFENALAFSPPDEPVEVRGRRTADGYVIAGIRCEGSLPVDTSATENELLCSADPGSGVVGRAEPVAVRLDIDGRIRWTAVGRPVDPSRFGGLAPTRDGALHMSGDSW
jgi:hypothetical protein